MYLSYHDKNTSQKTKSLFSRLKIWLLLGVVAAGGYYGYTNSPRILFLIKKDRYVPLEEAMKDLSVHLAENNYSDPGKNSEVSKTIALLNQLSKDHPGDAHLYLLKGKLYSILLESQEKQNPNLKIDIIYNHYIKRDAFPRALSAKFWKQSVAAYRKSLVLNLPADQRGLVKEKLLELYFLQGEPYWNSARPYLKGEQSSQSHIYQLYGIIQKDLHPDWELLKEKYNPESTILLEALYYLYRGNTPVAFGKLKELALSSSPYLRNNAMFLMGSLIGKTKNFRMKLYYYRQIDLDEFLPRNTWFLSEFHNSLRFVGKNKEAKKLLENYEKTVLQLENQRS